MIRLSHILLPPSPQAIAHDVADCLEGEGFHLRDAGDWREALAYIGGRAPWLRTAIKRLDPELHPALVWKVRRILEDRKAERRREYWANVWAWSGNCLMATAIFLLFYLAVAAAQAALLLIYGNQPN